MPIYRTTLVNFTVFERAEFEFSRGINVLIGKNGTGKSHVLKALYGMAEGGRHVYRESASVLQGFKSMARRSMKSELADLNEEQFDQTARATVMLLFFQTLFNPGERILASVAMNKLFRKLGQHPEEPARLAVGVGFANDENKDVLVLMGEPKDEEHGEYKAGPLPADTPAYLAHRSMFVPPREVLTMYPGFAALYRERRISFDRTYYDLCEALSLPLLREPTAALATLMSSLESELGGRVALRGDRFVIERDSGEIDIHLEAEGLRKLAMIMHLIANGSLEPGGYLFWDEPEANMNPKLVVLIKDLLVGLAKAGVQVFIATHDYLLCSELSLFSEYANPEDKDLVKFFCLNKDKHTDPVSVKSGAVLADLSHNPIVEEFTAHYEREAKMFAEKH